MSHSVSARVEPIHSGVRPAGRQRPLRRSPAGRSRVGRDLLQRPRQRPVTWPPGAAFVREVASLRPASGGGSMTLAGRPAGRRSANRRPGGAVCVRQRGLAGCGLPVGPRPAPSAAPSRPARAAPPGRSAPGDSAQSRQGHRSARCHWPLLFVNLFTASSLLRRAGAESIHAHTWPPYYSDGRMASVLPSSDGFRNWLLRSR